VVADVCARLQDLDLVWRERDPDDRRRMLVVPTAKGLRLADEVVPRLDRDAVAGALDRLSPAERAALVSAVRVLQEAGAASSAR
jgi:DNA-binding MarR family transcriptional regulator